MKKTKKIISLILAVLMMLSVVPIQGLAADEPILEKIEIADTAPISYSDIESRGGADYMGMDTDRLYDISGWYPYGYKLYFSDGQVLNTLDNKYGEELEPYGLTGYYVETLFSRKVCLEAIEKGYPTVKVTVKVNLYKVSGEEEIKEFELDRTITKSIVKSVNLIGDMPVYFDDYSFRESLYGRDFEVEFYDGKKEIITFDGYLGYDYVYPLYHEERQEIDGATGETVFYRDLEFHFIDDEYRAATERIDCPFEKIEIINYKFDRQADLSSVKYKVTYKDGRTAEKKESFDVTVDITSARTIGTVEGYPIYAFLNIEETDYTLELSAGYNIWNIKDSKNGEMRDICKCICHKNGILYLIGFFVIVFWRALNSHIKCDCGHKHY